MLYITYDVHAINVLSKKIKKDTGDWYCLGDIHFVTGFPAVTSSSTVLAQQQDSDTAPAPPSIGADIPLTYFGPAPSEVNPSYIGPLQLLRSGPVDLNASTVTLPLYKGQLVTGETVWYVLTDTTDKGNAEALGLNWSPKLTYSALGARVAKSWS